ncbi:MAG: hypothetical protein GX827_05045 [Clostridiales bacterium]|nr:hypothetical protein [Clostridiales bacterium]
MKFSEKLLKTLSGALVIMLAASAFACASDRGDDGENTDTRDGSEGIEAEETTAAENALELPAELDYGGENIIIYGYDLYPKEHLAEELNGELVNDAVFNRNKNVEELLNVNISVVINPWDNDDCRKKIQSTSMAGDEDYTIYTGNTYNFTYLAAEGAFLDIKYLPHIDVDKPWWNRSSYDELSVGDRHMILMSDMCMSTFGNVSGIFFNKGHIANYGFDDPYKLVDENKWTLDKLIADTSSFYVDLNGNGERDEVGDIYGCYGRLQTWYYMAYAYVRVTEKNADNYPVIVFDSPRTEEILNKLRDWMVGSDGCWSDMGWTGVEEFGNGQNCVFLWRSLSGADYLRGADMEYGIVPNPKYDEKDDWRTSSGGLVVAFPVTAKNTERTSAAAEALAYYARELVTPAYVEQTIKVKGTRDEKAIEMVNIILDSIVYDFGVDYSGFSGWGYASLEYFKTTKGYCSFIEAYKSKADAELIEAADKILALDG